MRRSRRWRVTPIGWVVIATFVVCAVLLTFAAGIVQIVAGSVAGLLLLLLVSEGLSGEGDHIGSTGRKREALQRDRFGDRDDR
jgi:hypothetical protein